MGGRRRVGKARALAAPVLAALALGVTVAGCGDMSAGAVGSRAAIRVAYQDQIAGGIDPATFYSVEGDSVILSVYQTLLTYKPGTNKLAPSLATSWSVSPDGKTYTFRLRKGVRFQDGTGFESKAVKESFEREIAVKGGPSYMLEEVARILTPSPYKVVIQLKQPVAAFLNFNASMYGPKIVSPKALREHGEGDEAKRWLSEHADGTGPFELVSYRPSGPIVLHRFAGYWGPKARSEAVEITVVPNIGDQMLQLRSGQLNLIAHGVEPQLLPGIEADSAQQVLQFPAVVVPVLLLNPTKPPFDERSVREAFLADSGAAEAAEQVYESTAEPATTVVPPQLMPARLDPLPSPGPPRPAPTSQEITLTYTNIESDLRHLAERMQESLKSHGWNVTLRADSVNTQFGYASNPKAGPEAALSTYNPDAAGPATWLDPIYHTAGGLNLLGFSDKSLDRTLDEAGATVDQKQSLLKYAAAAREAGEQFAVIPIAVKNDVIVAGSNLTGFVHVPTYIWTVDYADLEEK
ncbi:MAG: hypothetical protein JSU06_05050 [Actinobacteria bacterium]|nr:hypothetical protein [Actinomycetota bacterium]